VIQGVVRGTGLGLILLVSAIGTAAAQAVEGYRVGDLAPVIQVNDLDGEPVDLGQYLGSVPVLLEFWATWCELCEALLPHVRDMADRYGPSVAFIGINIAVNQSPGRVRRYIEQHQPPFRTLYDNEGTSVRALHVPTTSYVVIVDRHRVIRYIGVGGDQDLTEVLRLVTSDQEERF
jgi:thiol-disulfide isomerase/thioredoxin